MANKQNATDGEKIKELARYSADGLHMAMKSTLSSKEYKEFMETVEKITNVLPDNSGLTKVIKKRKSKPESLPSIDIIFREKILPQIRREVQQHKCNEVQKIPEVNGAMNFSTKFDNMTIDQLKTEHDLILKQQKTLKQLELIWSFYRGMLYLSAYNYAACSLNFKKWFPDNLGISYDVARRYWTVALLLRNCPRLLMCGLTFSQLAKHNKNILDHLKEDDALQAELSLTVDLNVNGQMIKIMPSEVPVPALAFDQNDPDSEYYMLDSANNETPLDNNEVSFQAWYHDHERELPSLLFPHDDDDEENGEIVGGAVGGQPASASKISTPLEHAGQRRVLQSNSPSVITGGMQRLNFKSYCLVDPSPRVNLPALKDGKECKKQQ